MENFNLPTGPNTRLPEDGSLNRDMRHSPIFHRHTNSPETAFVLDESDGKEQFILSQLASLIMNVANVFPYKTEGGDKQFMSPNIEDQYDYDSNKSVSLEDKLLFGFLFGDLDHMEERNHGGGVFYDFNSSDILLSDNEYGVEEKSNYDRTIRKFDRIVKSENLDINHMLEKANELLSHLSKESGLNFITALCKKAEYTALTPEQLQERLLSTTNKTIAHLSRVI